MIPDGWQLKSLNELVGHEGLIKDGDWIESKDQDHSGNVQLVQLADIGDGVLLGKSSRYMTLEQAQELDCTFLKEGDLLIARMPDPIGRACIFSGNKNIKVTVVDVCIVRTSESVNNVWLKNAINSHHIRNEIESLSSGSTRVRISTSKLVKIHFSTPPLHEQKKIAVILTSVDEVIEKTRAQIAKLKDLKTAMMQELFTLGLDEHNNLRSETKHKFKDSPLGKIPVEWEIRSLCEIVDEDISYGIVQAGPHVEDGIPYIRTGDMSGSRINLAQLLRTSHKIAGSYKRSEVHFGDIVFALRGTVGKVLPISYELEGANLTQGTAKISPKPSIETLFLLYALRTSYIHKQICLHQKGSTFMEITLGDLRTLKLALPISQNEQFRIAQMLSCNESLHSKYTDRNLKLRSLKKALMQDLLTGKVRVNVA